MFRTVTVEGQNDATAGEVLQTGARPIFKRAQLPRPPISMWGQGRAPPLLCVAYGRPSAHGVGTTEILSSCRLRSAACPIEHVAVAFWVETPGSSSERLERSLRRLRRSAGRARSAKPVPADKPRQALFTTHANMMAQGFRWPSSFRKACSGRQTKTSSVHNANQDRLCASRPGSQPANPGGRRGGDHNSTYNLTYNPTLSRMQVEV